MKEKNSVTKINKYMVQKSGTWYYHKPTLEGNKTTPDWTIIQEKIIKVQGSLHNIKEGVKILCNNFVYSLLVILYLVVTEANIHSLDSEQSLQS